MLVQFIYCYLFTFICSCLGINFLIKSLKKHHKFQPIRVEGPESHMLKAKTPTMGGLAFNLSMILSILLFCNLRLQTTYMFITIILGFGLIGLIDDIMKVFFNDTIGFKGYIKLILEIALASIVLMWCIYQNNVYLTNSFLFPFFNKWISFGFLALPFTIIAMAGSSNATNITDGLDGLLSMPIIFVSLTLLSIVLFFLNENQINNLIFIDEIELINIAKLLVIIIGAFSAFLCFNKHPAKIFMGDVGSLTIGALLFFIAFLLKIELYYAIMALLFIVELSSTFLQVLFYKITKKRIFKMAPIHHHFEKSGWPETKVVACFWGFSLISCLLSLLLLFF